MEILCYDCDSITEDLVRVRTASKWFTAKNYNILEALHMDQYLDKEGNPIGRSGRLAGGVPADELKNLI